MGELGEFVKHNGQLQSLGIQLLAISVDLPAKALEARRKLAAPFVFLSDSDRKVMDLYGTRSPVWKGPGGSAINTPTLILIDKAGIIRWIHQATDYKVRPPAAEAIEEARKLQ